MDDKKLQGLYDKYKQLGATEDNIGTYDQFKEFVTDEAKAKRVYNNLVSDGVIDKNKYTENDMLSTYGVLQEKPVAQTQTASPVQQQPVQQQQSVEPYQNQYTYGDTETQAGRQINPSASYAENFPNQKEDFQQAGGTSYVPKDENVEMKVPTSEDVEQYPWLREAMEKGTTVPFGKNNNVPYHEWTDADGNPITNSQAAALEHNADITGNESIRPKLASAGLWLPEVEITGSRAAVDNEYRDTPYGYAYDSKTGKALPEQSVYTQRSVGQERDAEAAAANVLVNNPLDDIIHNAIVKHGDTARDTEQEINSMIPANASGVGNMSQWAGTAVANKMQDPDKITATVSQGIESYINSKQFDDALTKQAENVSISKEDLKKQAIGQLKDEYKARLEDQLIKQEMPKSTIDYILRGVENSVGGMLASANMQSAKQKTIRDTATQMYGENAGTAARLANMGTGFLMDAPAFGMTGMASGKVAESVAARQLGNMMSRGMSKEAATRIIATSLENSMSSRVADAVVKRVASGAANLGLYNVIQDPIQQYASTGKVDLTQTLERGLEGIGTGSMLGVMGGLIGGSTAKLAGNAKRLANVGAILGEAAAFTGSNMIFGGAEADDGKGLGEKYIDNLMQVLVMKATSGENPLKPLAEILNGRPQSIPNTVKFSDRELAEIKSATGERSLKDALVNEVTKRDVKDYASIVRNKDVSYPARAKASWIVSGVKPDTTMPLSREFEVKENADGTVTITTRDGEGYKNNTHTFSDAEAARQFETGERYRAKFADYVDEQQVKGYEAGNAPVENPDEQLSDAEIHARLRELTSRMQNLFHGGEIPNAQALKKLFYDADTKVRDLVGEYLYVRSMSDGRLDRYYAETNDMVRESDASVDAISDRATGEIRPAVLASGEEVYILDGYIPDAEGNTAGSVSVLPKTGGEPRIVDAGEIADISEPWSASVEKTMKAGAIRNDRDAVWNKAATGMVPGDVIEVPGADGKTETAKVVSVYYDGSYDIRHADGREERIYGEDLSAAAKRKYSNDFTLSPDVYEDEMKIAKAVEKGTPKEEVETPVTDETPKEEVKTGTPVTDGEAGKPVVMPTVIRDGRETPDFEAAGSVTGTAFLKENGMNDSDVSKFVEANRKAVDKEVKSIKSELVKVRPREMSDEEFLQNAKLNKEAAEDSIRRNGEARKQRVPRPAVTADFLKYKEDKAAYDAQIQDIDRETEQAVEASNRQFDKDIAAQAEVVAEINSRLAVAEKRKAFWDGWKREIDNAKTPEENETKNETKGDKESKEPVENGANTPEKNETKGDKESKKPVESPKEKEKEKPAVVPGEKTPEPPKGEKTPEEKPKTYEERKAEIVKQKEDELRNFDKLAKQVIKEFGNTSIGDIWKDREAANKRLRESNEKLEKLKAGEQTAKTKQAIKAAEKESAEMERILGELQDKENAIKARLEEVGYYDHEKKYHEAVEAEKELEKERAETEKTQEEERKAVEEKKLAEEQKAEEKKQEEKPKKPETSTDIVAEFNRRFTEEIDRLGKQYLEDNPEEYRGLTDALRSAKLDAMQDIATNKEGALYKEVRAELKKRMGAQFTNWEREQGGNLKGMLFRLGLLVGDAEAQSAKESAEKEQRKSEEEQRARELAEQERAKQERTEKEQELNKYGEFVDSKSNVQKAAINKALDKRVNFGEGCVKTVAEFVRGHIEAGDLKLETYEEDRLKSPSRRAWNRMTNDEQRAAEQRVKDGGKVTKYLVNGYDLGKTAYDYAEYLSKKNETAMDHQGNPLNADGTLKLDKVMSVDDLTDEDFSHPTRSVELPKVPENVDKALGAVGKPVIIKKNIFEKNWKSHKFPFSESRSILKSALYNTDLVGQTQPAKRPLHWVAIKLDEKSPIVVLEVNENKDNVEIVGWYTLDERNLGRIKRQAEKNGGGLVMLSPKDKVESLSTPQHDLSSNGKDTGKVSHEQKGGVKNVVNQNIDDWGEEIAGARKNALKELAKQIGNVTIKDLIAQPLSKVFKAKDYRKMVEKGELTPNDAKLFEAITQLILNDKKPVKSASMRGYKLHKAESEIEEWANRVHVLMSFMKAYSEAENPESRKAIMDALLREPEGEEAAPNPLKFTMDILDGIGYEANGIGKAKIPTIKLSYGSYRVCVGKETIQYCNDRESALNEAIKIAKVSRGDADVEYMRDDFVKVVKEQKQVPNGTYMLEVTSAKSFNVKRYEGFPNEEAALKKEEELKAKSGDNFFYRVRPETKWTPSSYTIKVIDPVTRERESIEVGLRIEKIEDANAYIDEHFEELQDKANEVLSAKYAQASRKSKGSVDLNIGFDSKTGTYDVWMPTGRWSGLNLMHTLVEGFKTHAEAKKWIEENRAKIEEIVAQRKKAQRDFVYFSPEKPRIGTDWRKGRDVSVEEFGNTFGFRGVQFGNWTNQRDRQNSINEAYDAFKDLAAVLKISDKALSLNGELGIAFGARGSGEANAHYERDNVVINLTKTRGAGSLAHEWWHALDNYLSRRGGVNMGMLTNGSATAADVRSETRKAFSDLANAISGSQYDKRSSLRGAYWGSKEEETARLFAEWVNFKLKQMIHNNSFLTQGVSASEIKDWMANNYKWYKLQMELANKGLAAETGKAVEVHDAQEQKPVMSFEEFANTEEALAGFPLPTEKEVAEFDKVMQTIFDTIKERENPDGSVALFDTRDAAENIAETRKDIAETRKDIAERIVVPIRKAGIDVITDKEEMRKVLSGLGYMTLHDVDTNAAADVQFLKTDKGEVFGFVKDGKMYLDPDRMNPNTTVHEYTHLWDEAVRKKNPELWSQGVELMKQTPVWSDVANDANYANIRDNENLVASEVHSRLTGEKADEILNGMIDAAKKGGSPFEVAKAVSLVDKLRKWIQNTYKYVKDTFSPWTKEQAKNVSLEDFLDMTLNDLLNGKPIGKPIGKTVVDGYDVVVKNEGDNSKNILFHIADGKEVNEHFNHELTRYQNGEMDVNEMLHLGRPQGVMRAFLPNLPIVMRQRVIKKGSEKKHEVDVSAIMNMPQHLSSPIFVFKRSGDTIGVLTDMRDRNVKNVCVAIELKRQIQQGAEYLEVNDVRSFHGREFKNIVEPIANNKTLKWVNKEKGLAYLSSASQPVQQEIDKQVLNTATKVVKDFVNPTISEKKDVNRDNDRDNDKTMFRILEKGDPKLKELESLSDDELVPVYRNVQVFEDDALGSPMAYIDAKTGERRTLEGNKWNESTEPKIELTDEQQRKLDELNKNGYIMVDGRKSTELQISENLKFVKPKTKDAQLQYYLKKSPEDKGLWAAYDPYDHAIETPLNTQFAEAYKRPNLVVVRSLIPKSEIDSPYKAEHALLPTGAHQWNNGRTLYLSRYSKIDKVLSREEEADLIDKYWKKNPGKRDELKSHRDYNRFVPQVRIELEKKGYRFEYNGKELTPEESLALDKEKWADRDIIPGKEGKTPFVTSEDIDRINKKVSGEWVGEPKQVMEDAMVERVNELSRKLNTKVRIVRTEDEMSQLPTDRHRRMKGGYDTVTGEVTVVVPNNANVADVENTVVHEIVGHDGMRVLFPEKDKLNNALDEMYRVSNDDIRATIDAKARKMQEQYAAEGHGDAESRKADFLRDATEEYGAELAGRIGDSGFERMTAEEQTFWGKMKKTLQAALDNLMSGLGIKKKTWSDKDWAYVLHEAYKRKRNGGNPTVFDVADTSEMRRKTGFGKTMMRDEDIEEVKPEDSMSRREQEKDHVDDALMDAFGGSTFNSTPEPKRRAGESEKSYKERLRQYYRDQVREGAPSKDAIQQRWVAKFEKDYNDWRDRNESAGDAITPESGESMQDFAVRSADAGKEGEPDLFTYLAEADKEYRTVYERWKIAADAPRSEDADKSDSELLYEGRGREESSEEEHYENLYVDAMVDRKFASDNAVAVDDAGARRRAKLNVIERRKDIESASAEDSIYIHDLCKQTDAAGKKAGYTGKQIREAIPFAIEARRRARDIVRELQGIDAAADHDTPKMHYLPISINDLMQTTTERAELKKAWLQYVNAKDTASSEEARRNCIEKAQAVADAMNFINTDHRPLSADDIMQEAGAISKDIVPVKYADAVNTILSTPELSGIVDGIQLWYKSFFGYIEDAGLRGDAGCLAGEYVNHMWDKKASDPKAWKQYVENRQRLTSANMRHREISTYVEGMEVGLVPKTLDIAEIMAWYSRSNIEAVCNRRFLDNMKYINVTEPGTGNEQEPLTYPMISTEKPLAWCQDRYSEPYYVPGIGDVWVYAPVKSRFAAVFGPMRTPGVSQWMTDTASALDKTASVMKKVQLSISGFHAGALSEVALAQMNPAKGTAAVFKALTSNLSKYHDQPAFANPEDFKDAAAHLVQLGATQDYSSSDVNAITTKFKEHIEKFRDQHKNLGTESAALLAEALDWANKGFDKVLWNYLHDGLKIQCFKMFREQIEARAQKENLSEDTVEQLLDEAGQYVNDTFGGQYWELLGISPGAVKWMRRFLLSPDWLVSTQRHFLANFGFGSIYSESGWHNYLKYNADNLKRFFGADIAHDEFRRFRSSNAKKCYILGVGFFFYPLMNMLNAWFRQKDEDDEKAKADEMRKTDPSYKSPYEMAYPDGMKWYDYTMMGNVLGQQTHLFMGRYKDGTEQYVRWGKQFRELPEMFIGRKGVDFPTPMIERMMGKSNPVIGTVKDLMGSLGVWGFSTNKDTEEIIAKHGNKVAALATTAKHFLPFSVPTQADKEFKVIDFFMPSQKGFSKGKTLSFLKDFIQAGDTEGIRQTLRSALANGIDAEKLLELAEKEVEATQRSQIADGAIDLKTSMDLFDQTTDPVKKAVYAKQIKRYQSAEAEKNYATVNDIISQYVSNGEEETDAKTSEKLLLNSKSSDLILANKQAALKSKAKKLWDNAKKDAGLRMKYQSWYAIGRILNQCTRLCNQQASMLTTDPGNPGNKAIMNNIRQIRQEAEEQLAEVPMPQ